MPRRQLPGAPSASQQVDVFQIDRLTMAEDRDDYREPHSRLGGRDSHDEHDEYLTAVSISSTHMKMMIAFRWMRTPITPMMNSAAVRASDSASTGCPPPRQDHGTSDGNQQQDARQLERQQIIVEQWRCDGTDGVE